MGATKNPVGTCVLLLLLLPGCRCSCECLCCCCCCCCCNGFAVESCLMTQHVASVEFEKDRNLRHHRIQTVNALFLFACCVLGNTLPGEKERVERREERESPNTYRKLILIENNATTSNKLTKATNCAPASLFNASGPLHSKGGRPAQVQLDKFFLHDASISPNRCTGQGDQHVCKFFFFT